MTQLSSLFVLIMNTTIRPNETIMDEVIKYNRFIKLENRFIKLENIFFSTDYSDLEGMVEEEYNKWFN